jgi:hypothetical protein
LVPNIEGGFNLGCEAAGGLSEEDAALAKNSVKVLAKRHMAWKCRYQDVIEIPSSLGRSAFYE